MVGNTGIHIDVHGLPGVLVNHVDGIGAVGAVKIFAELVNVFHEFPIQVYLPHCQAYARRVDNM